MRIWSIHPRYLDPAGLVALWRETLLAQKVLRGLTRGYRSHPQLTRFLTRTDPVGAVGAYLTAVADEAEARGYRFDRSRIFGAAPTEPLMVTSGQVAYEWSHLLAKLARRSPALLTAHAGEESPELHPLFVSVPGGIEPWERP